MKRLPVRTMPQHPTCMLLQTAIGRRSYGLPLLLRALKSERLAMFLNTLQQRICPRTYYCAVPALRCYSEKVRMLPSRVSSYTSPYFPEAVLQSTCGSRIRPIGQAHGPRHRYRCIFSRVGLSRCTTPRNDHPYLVSAWTWNTTIKCSHISSRPCL